MKASILVWKYDDNSNFGIIRVYKEADRANAEDDLKLFQEHASDCKSYKLIESDFFSK